MGVSFKIARISGIDIKVHITFFLILVLAGVQWGGITGTALGALFGIVLMILLFVCVTLHELGHSIVAQRFGIPVREITLLPLGGVAQLSKNPDKPLHELLIALAGPLVNVVIALVLVVVLGMNFGIGLLDGKGLIPDIQTTTIPTLLNWLLAANISLVLFNMIPAFPLDGGRVLRALLAMRLGYPQATRIASGIGQIIAIGFGVYGVVSGQYLLVLTAIFIFFGAGQENSAAQAKTVLVTRKIGDAYNKHALTLQVGDRVSRVVDFILTSYQPDFAVMQGTKPIGIVTREVVQQTLAKISNDAFVTDIMLRDYIRLDAQMTLEAANTILAESNTRVGAVFHGNAYLGLISREDIAEAYAVLSFMRASDTPQPA